ncbi:MAG: AraC family transcriptional regulator [Bacteroidales bacterium]|nr:AraC family transcriptional regulator [Bacteroidales bacterium]
MKHTVRNMDEFNAFFHQETANPMVGIGDLSDAELSLFEPLDFGCYCVVLMDSDFGILNKGGNIIRYRPGTMFTMKPGEIVYMDLNDNPRPRGKMLAFRPELMENTGLGRDFYLFNYFDFEAPEALLLNDTERKVMLNCFSNIEAELKAENDELTSHMLRLGIGQTLSYCKRYYERQFDSRQLKSSDFIKRLDSLLDGYFAQGSDLPKTNGYPTVAWCSSQFHLAPNYFGNLVRKDLHISAQEYIHNKVMEQAKTLLADPSNSVNQVAEALGFDYPNHFSRLFRKMTGMSPSSFRKTMI